MAPTTPFPLPENPGSPTGIPIPEHGQTHYGTTITVLKPVVIAVHPPGQIPIRLALHFNVHQQPLLGTIHSLHLHELVHPQTSRFRIPNHLLQFLVEEQGIDRPIDPPLHHRKTKRQKRPEINLQGLLPRPVVINGVHPFRPFWSVTVPNPHPDPADCSGPPANSARLPALAAFKSIAFSSAGAATPLTCAWMASGVSPNRTSSKSRIPSCRPSCRAKRSMVVMCAILFSIPYSVCLIPNTTSK